MAIDIIARGMIESSKSDISQLFDITKGGEIVNNESSYTLSNAVDYPLLGLNLYGKSTQDGTPTPENPVDIVSVGDSGTVGIVACGKNLIKTNSLDCLKSINISGVWNENTYYSNGITFTINNDMSITVNGTASGQSILSFSKNLSDLRGNYIISGCPDSAIGTVGTYMLTCIFKENGTTTYAAERGNGLFVNLTDDKFLTAIIIEIKSGISVNNEIFYPMIRHKSVIDTTYEPYKGTTANITTELPLCGIPVDNYGNYTDGNGQRWVCDELIYNADGTGKIIKRLGSFTIDGTEKFKTYDSASTKEISIISEKYNEIKQPKSTRSVPIIISDILSSDTAVNVWNMAKDNIIGIHYETVENKGSLRIYSTYFSSADVAKSFFTDNPKNIIAELAEPQEIELTAAEMTALRQLQTFNGITNIFNDSGADMGVKFCTNKALSEYVIPITTGLQKQIDELKAAVLSLGGNV